ncbi:MAG TPA: glycosyltransferase family 87 protein [Gemmatimonadales bacterium]|jgi:hypothetical protein|nr:glycosyltransferase family 87 protein [Gemmatimonadales bacterium]
MSQHVAADNRINATGRWIAPLTALITVVWLSLSRAADFLVYWQAGRALVTTGWTGVYAISIATPFKYHPVFAVLSVPFGLMPWAVAKVVWAALSALLVFDVQRRWRANWRIDAVAIGMGFICVGHALFWQYQFGNVDFVMLWLWSVAATTRRSWVAAICSATLIALKPFWLALLLAWVVARRWRLIVEITAAVVALSLVPLLAGTASFLVSYQRWFATFADPADAHNFPKHDNQTWYGLLVRHAATLGHSLPLLWLVGSGMVGLIWLWQWRNALRVPVAPDQWWQLELSLIPFILWTAPLSWIHHQILLWPLLAIAWQVGRRERWARATFLISLVLLTVLSQSIIGRAATVTVLELGIPLAAFPLVVWWSSARFSRAPFPAL